MKIILEFTDIEKFFTELPRFAALMNFSGQFATFDHIKKSDLVSNLEEPAIPIAFKSGDGSTIVRGTEEQVMKAREAGDIAGRTVSQLDKRKKDAAEKKAAKAKAAEGTENEAQDPQEAPEDAQPVKSTTTKEKAAQEPESEADEAVKDTDVRKIMNRLIKSGHREDLKRILSEFGAKNFTELKEKNYPDVMKKAKEVLEGE